MVYGTGAGAGRSSADGLSLIALRASMPRDSLGEVIPAHRLSSAERLIY